MKTSGFRTARRGTNGPSTSISTPGLSTLKLWTRHTLRCLNMTSSGPTSSACARKTRCTTRRTRWLARSGQLPGTATSCTLTRITTSSHQISTTVVSAWAADPWRIPMSRACFTCQCLSCRIRQSTMNSEPWSPRRSHLSDCRNCPG